jgi:hypothetical protein
LALRVTVGRPCQLQELPLPAGACEPRTGALDDRAHLLAVSLIDGIVSASTAVRSHRYLRSCRPRLVLSERRNHWFSMRPLRIPAAVHAYERVGAVAGKGRSRGSGRPPKFPGPSRVITLTLPESTLRDLRLLDPDRARAIVQATEMALQLDAEHGAGQSVELQPVTQTAAVITVPFSRALSNIAGMTLIRFTVGRYLVILDPSISLSDLEVALSDVLEDTGEEAEDRPLIERLLDQLKALRRGGRAFAQTVILVSL